MQRGIWPAENGKVDLFVVGGGSWRANFMVLQIFGRNQAGRQIRGEQNWRSRVAKHNGQIDRKKPHTSHYYRSVADSETNNSMKRPTQNRQRAPHFIVKEERVEVGGINTIISQHIPHTIFPARRKSFFYEKYYFIVLDGTSLALSLIVLCFAQLWLSAKTTSNTPNNLLKLCCGVHFTALLLRKLG